MPKLPIYDANSKWLFVIKSKLSYYDVMDHSVVDTYVMEYVGNGM